MIEGPQKRAEAAGIPYRAHVIVTHRCNLACDHCYQAEHAGPELSLAELESLFDQLASLGTLFLVIGGGEPMARRDFWEIIEAARRRRFAIQLYTNGTMIDEAAARRLKAAAVTLVSVSLHGGGPATHDALVHRPGAYERIQRAIGLLEHEGIPVAVKTSVTSTNAREVPALLQQLRTPARPLVALSLNHRMFVRDDGDPAPLLLAPDEAQLREASAAELAAGGEVMIRERWEHARASAQASSQRSPCQAARTAVTVHPTGDVTPCNQLTARVMGNVRSQALDAIWRHSAAAQRVREVAISGFQAEHAECRTCPYRGVCAKCMAMSENETGSLTGHSAQVCRTTKAYWGEVRRRAEALGLEWPS